MNGERYPLVRGFPDPLPVRRARIILVVLMVAYGFLAAGYALRTPLWQVPDEPAHVNYARYVAQTGRLPVLSPGDYDAAYLEAIKAAKFPPNMPVTSIRYESHQPPLYYVAAALLLRLTAAGALVADPPQAALAQAVYTMRFLSLALGLGLLLLVYATLRVLFPAHPSLALAATAMVAFIPQHVAMLAGANNDAMAEMWLAAWLAILVRSTVRQRRPHPVGLGLLLGLILLTKTTAYLPAFFALAAWALSTLRQEGRKALQTGALAVVIGLLVASPFYVRNLLVYGWPDVLGWRRHAAVVVGQPTTAAFVAEHGWRAYWERAITWTFRSFWGQFGWMGVLMDDRVYRGLLFYSLVCAAAAGRFLVRLARESLGGGRTPEDTLLLPTQRRAYGVLLAAALGTVLSYVGYNVTFLQHQGRYLFTALLPMAAVTMPGLWWVLADRTAPRLGLACALLAVLTLGAAALDLGPFTRWDTLTWFGLGAWFGAAARWPRLRPLWLLLPWVALAPLAYWALERFVLPALA